MPEFSNLPDIGTPFQDRHEELMKVLEDISSKLTVIAGCCLAGEKLEPSGLSARIDAPPQREAARGTAGRGGLPEIRVSMDHGSESMRYVAEAVLLGRSLHKLEKPGGPEVQGKLFAEMVGWLKEAGYTPPERYWSETFPE